MDFDFSDFSQSDSSRWGVPQVAKDGNTEPPFSSSPCRCDPAAPGLRTASRYIAEASCTPNSWDYFTDDRPWLSSNPHPGVGHGKGILNPRLPGVECLKLLPSSAPRRRKFILTVDHLIIAMGVVAALVFAVALYRNSHGDHRASPGSPFPLSIVVGDRTVTAVCVVHERRAKLTFETQAVPNTANNAYLIAQAIATEAMGLPLVLSGTTATQTNTNIPGVGNEIPVTRYATPSGAFYAYPVVRDDHIAGLICWVGSR